MPEPADESALIVPLLAADGALHRWRSALDPSAAQGVPAHVTIHYPWIPLQQVDETVLATWKR